MNKERNRIERSERKRMGARRARESTLGGMEDFETPFPKTRAAGASQKLSLSPNCCCLFIRFRGSRACAPSPLDFSLAKIASWSVPTSRASPRPSKDDQMNDSATSFNKIHVQIYARAVVVLLSRGSLSLSLARARYL